MRAGEREVAPYVGAWIETLMIWLHVPLLSSHPMWVRGLKPDVRSNLCTWIGVAPYVGAWIETSSESLEDTRDFVAPYVGAWIET